MKKAVFLLILLISFLYIKSYTKKNKIKISEPPSSQIIAAPETSSVVNEKVVQKIQTQNENLHIKKELKDFFISKVKKVDVEEQIRIIENSLISKCKFKNQKDVLCENVCVDSYTNPIRCEIKTEIIELKTVCSNDSKDCIPRSYFKNKESIHSHQIPLIIDENTCYTKVYNCAAGNLIYEEVTIQELETMLSPEDIDSYQKNLEEYAFLKKVRAEGDSALNKLFDCLFTFIPKEIKTKDQLEKFLQFNQNNRDSTNSDDFHECLNL